MRVMLLSLLCACSFVHADERHDFGASTVSVGDKTDHLVDVAGHPTSKETIPSNRPGFSGQRWDYQQGGKSVSFLIGQAQVQGIANNSDAVALASAKHESSTTSACDTDCGTH